MPAPPPVAAPEGGPRDLPSPTRRTLSWRAYGLLRPLVRPVFWRMRTFLIGQVRDEVVELRAQVEALRASVDALRAQVELRTAQEREALTPKIQAVMEQAILTIALDREDRRR